MRKRGYPVPRHRVSSPAREEERRTRLMVLCLEPWAGSQTANDHKLCSHLEVGLLILLNPMGETLFL
eukprot:1158365-Pelagomonas_calceolata.AAC.9